MIEDEIMKDNILDRASFEEALPNPVGPIFIFLTACSEG